MESLPRMAARPLQPSSSPVAKSGRTLGKAVPPLSSEHIKQ